ncbi:hypothetical protein K432DRAFT_299085 [Lepidopterella palustris CBS 459.81]|uniref:Dynamin family protein n=1 Tax=Lepidopterella palustris CBS 459.81 TaxID=1314670 RepID=A0A8E2JEU2_9PEZI|nr:hypothetical protein K432DRAFT_299085 [Lepidopterella palustris CBS 459.81]
MAATADALRGTALDQLQSEDQARLFDVIDQLRSQGVGRLLGEEGLPQLIVCGDQSSGKSSVLEGLTKVRFPTKSKLCTTFATEVKLRRGFKTEMRARIKAGFSRKEDDKKRLDKFDESFSSLDELPALIDSARECMRETTGASANAYFEDVLQVRISGPSLTPLTIVDLPGLIHFPNEDQSDKDVDFVSNLVQSYMKQQNSIILAVISAHNDRSNQIVLKHAQKIVPDGNRTLGIITKPDTLPPESEKEQEYLDLAQNRKIEFEYGWHVVRNRNYETRDSTNEERDRVEIEFFETSAWADLPPSEVGLGIDTLRQKLNKMLLNHIRLSLPSIEEKLHSQIKESEVQQQKLGKSRETVEDQKKYLDAICDRFRDLTADALGGIYSRNTFFNDDEPYIDGYEKRLRAVVRNRNDKFAKKMHKKGHKWEITDDNERESGNRSSLLPNPELISRTKFLEKVVSRLAYINRGCELSGTPNVQLITSLFHEQSMPWEEIATLHLESVWEAVETFLETVLNHLTDERTYNGLIYYVVDPIMESRRKEVKNKLQELLTPYKHYEPINIDPQFSCIISALQQNKGTEGTTEASKNQCSAKKNENPLFSVPGSDSNDKHAYSYAVDVMEAYYKAAITIFINNVAILAIEQCLLRGLPGILSTTISDMDAETLKVIASESEVVKSKRIQLEKKLEILRGGLDTIRKINPRGKSVISLSFTGSSFCPTLYFPKAGVGLIIVSGINSIMILALTSSRNPKISCLYFKTLIH